ncbi:hypothetical protein [Burkholderia cenocepacia]|uniref:hypothetical protein n=1 Tax=Burkholderia cenocepacia TaxID=95486 RepID=UPI0019D0F1DC|nr:hypothetical protein [Burkholderia cenocepacia]
MSRIFRWGEPCLREGFDHVEAIAVAHDVADEAARDARIQFDHMRHAFMHDAVEMHGPPREPGGSRRTRADVDQRAQRVGVEIEFRRIAAFEKTRTMPLQLAQRADVAAVEILDAVESLPT